MNKHEEQTRRRLAVIEHEVLKTNDLIMIWKLKKEHAELTRLLRRIIRQRDNNIVKEHPIVKHFVKNISK